MGFYSMLLSSTYLESVRLKHTKGRQCSLQTTDSNPAQSHRHHKKKKIADEEIVQDQDTTRLSSVFCQSSQFVIALNISQEYHKNEMPLEGKAPLHLKHFKINEHWPTPDHQREIHVFPLQKCSLRLSFVKPHECLTPIKTPSIWEQLVPSPSIDYYCWSINRQKLIPLSCDIHLLSSLNLAFYKNP